ncbi:uncharacterized protein [Epargyreus clarus]|uniref:uncharacterized protein isoform X5 n=1 Tax=Epargyreus clarus TaxID=520877 RepID=UPI003C2F52D2
MIEFTIKTLDSNNHSITVEDDTTVFGLKQKLLEQLGIRIDRQRLIFFGRVLHDNKKLADYGVHGKVVHLVERPPPRSQQINNDGDAPPSGRIGRPASSDANDSDSTAPTAARIEFLQRSIEDIRGLLESLRAADTWLPSLGNPTNSARNDESKSHCPKGRRTCRFKSREATPNSDQNEVSTPTPGPSQPGPSQEQELKCESDLAQGTSEASVPSKSKASESTPSTATTTESAPGSCTENHNGHLPEARANLSRTEVYAQLLGDFLELEEQFRHYRTLYIDWIRSTPSYVCLTHINVNDVTLRRKQRFSNLISELHHSFAHAHHVISDINFYVSPITNLLISDPVIMASSNQGLSGGGLNPQRQQRTQQAFVVLPQHIIPHQQQNPTQRIAQIPIPQSMQHLPSELQIPLPPLLGQPPSPMMLHPMPPQMSHEIPQQMRPDVPLDYSHQMRRHTEDQMHRENVLESSPQEPRYPAAQPMQQHSPHHAFAELPIEQQMPPLQIQNQDPQQMHHHEDMHRDLPQMAPQAAPQPHQPQQPQQPHQPADGRRRGGNSGVHTPVLLGIPPQALNINVQSNPVTFQLEIETRSLEAALLNTVVNHVSQIVASQAAGNVPANNTTTTDSQATPQPTDNAQTGPQLQINPPILGLNLGTVHLGTFNLGNLSQAGGMDVDSQSAPQGTANMETDSQGTNRSATNNSNSNQENENQNGPTSRQQARLDVESLVRGIGQTHGVNDMDILMSIDVAGQHRTQAFVLNSASNNPGVAPGAQNPRAAGLGNPTETNPPPHPHYANPNAQRASRHRGRLFRAAERGDLMTDDFLINNPHLAECVLRSFEFEAEEIYYNTTETERVRRTLYRQANGYFHLDDVHIARLRTRTRVGGPNASQNVYDRFLSCNSGYARRQTQRRRRLADAARNSGEASVMENRPNEAQQPAAPPQNVTFEDAIQLMTSIEGNTTFTETMISSILLSCNEATLPEGAAPITTADYENIRRRFLLGIRHQSFSGANGNSTQGIPSIASVLIHLYQGIVRRMDNVSTPIQSQVDVAGTFRRLFLTYMVRLLTVMQRESITSFPRNYRRSFANFFYDFVGMLMHIAVNGVAGFRVIFGEIINELLTNVSDRVRRHMRVVGNVLLERAVSNRVRPSSGPHRFVVRRDRLPGCFCPKDPLVDEKEEEAPAVEPAPAAPAVLPALDIAGPSGSSPLTDMDTPPPNVLGRQPVRSNTDDEYVDFEDRSVAEAQRLLFEALRQTTQDQEHPAGSSNDVQASQQQPDTREQEQRNPRTDRQIEEELALITGQQSDTPEPLPPLVDLSSLNPPVETTPADINEPTSTSDPRGHYSAYTRSFESLPSSSGAPFRQHFQIDHNYGLSTPYTFQGSSGVQRPRRSIPTSTVTSSCLNNNNNNNPRSSPIVMSDSPPPRLATASPANKRMKQSTDANVDSQETQRSGSGATRKTSTETAESKRKVPSSRGSDRVPSESPSSEDSSESQRRFRVEQHWEREWVSVIDADQRAVAEAPTPYSDAYLSGMTARRRRRVRQTRPPLQAAAFIHECMSAASERAVEGGEVERAVFQAFLDNFRGLTAARVNASDDFRPALHTAVQKFLTRSSSLEESTRIPNQEETN